MKIVIGLGNPGARYRATRHNVGFDVLEELARRHGASTPTEKYEAEVSEVFVGGVKVILLAPQTFMNLSGRSVRKCFDFFQPQLEDLAVVCDDINLEVGRLRWRRKGSAGGQKGLLDIINRLGSEEIPRLRIGVGRPPGQMDAADYVLSRFRTEEQDVIAGAIRTAADSLEVWVSQGIGEAMNRYNSAGE